MRVVESATGRLSFDRSVRYRQDPSALVARSPVFLDCRGYAEVKALATGNPLILEKASVDSDVARLGRLRRAHLDDQHRLRRSLDTAESRAGSAGRRIGLLESALANGGR